MKPLIPIALFCLFSAAVHGQYYYKDLVVSGENIKKRALYELNKVKNIRFNSVDGLNQPIEGFNCNLEVNRSFTEITTVTSTGLTGATENTSYFNAAGQLVKSVDTSEGNKTVINYTWDAGNRISLITSQSFSPGGYVIAEQHHWFYSNAGKPEKMLKIKNEADTTYITFMLDDQGNVSEEKSVHRGQPLPTIYYYYDDKNRLTDIVRYNIRAKRLLPDYIFEYNQEDQLSTMLVVTEGTGDYQKWYYRYNDKALKVTDECYSKTKVLIGKINYGYQFF